MLLSFLKNFGRLLADAFKELKKNDPLRLAAATAFFTTFALPPILIIVIQLFGSLFNIDHFDDKFFVRLGETLGEESAGQIKNTFSGFKAQASNWMITVVGVVFLMFVATTLFTVIKDSLNQLWNIKLDNTKKFKVSLQNRMISMFVILLAGLLFVTGMVAEWVQAFLGDYLKEISPVSASGINSVISVIVSVVIVTSWFVILFKMLPDAKATWKVVMGGGFFTGLLFTLGKFVIRHMLALGNIQSVFGASTSIVLLLLFVFYSSFILYYGACFTKVYALFIKEPIEPATHAFKYELVEKKAD